MPEEPEKGVKDTGGTPPSDSGAGTGTPDPSGTPPEGEISFEDDQIREQDGEKLVPLDVAKAERKKRQDLESELERLRSAPPQPTETEPEPEAPVFDWDKLMQPASPEPTTQQPQVQPNQQNQMQEWNDQFREMLDTNPTQALMTAFSMGIQQYETLQRQAKQFVPDYDNLPVHEVSDQEIQALAGNPHALRAMIAKAKASGTTPQPQNPTQPNQPTPPMTNPAANPATNVPNNPQTEKDQWIAEGRKQEREMIANLGRSSGVTGEGAGGGTPPPAGSGLELDKNSMEYFKTRGYSDEEAATMAGKVQQLRFKRGMAQ